MCKLYLLNKHVTPEFIAIGQFLEKPHFSLIFHFLFLKRGKEWGEYKQRLHPSHVSLETLLQVANIDEMFLPILYSVVYIVFEWTAFILNGLFQTLTTQRA